MIDIGPLALIQARYASTRLPGKMLETIRGKELLRIVYESTVTAFGEANTVIATTDVESNQPLLDWLVEKGYPFMAWNGDENDVLGRFHHVANSMRWHPDSIIVRVTPDDVYKSPEAMQAVATGLRLPVELGGEAFTLGMLNEAQAQLSDEECCKDYREHLTHALFATSPPPAPPGRTWTIDTQQDLDAVRSEMGSALDIIS